MLCSPKLRSPNGPLTGQKSLAAAWCARTIMTRSGPVLAMIDGNPC
jgi:hypothetical protein